jgi:hypothetical protein
LSSACACAEHGALLELEQYFKLIGQDISGAVHTGALIGLAWQCSALLRFL